MTVGMLLGMISFKLGGIPVTLGSGVGCLLSGLFFGWLRFTRPRFAALPDGATNFLRDFGLAVFVALVGINAAPQALEAIKQNGLTLLLLGAGVTIIPQIITFYISYFALRIRNPIIAMSAVAGGRSANPAFAALLEKAGNTTPVATFTITYAIANIFLTLWGPVVVGVVQTNAVVGGG
jgi:AspT/YidE/YbjL antiporter-like protein